MKKILSIVFLSSVVSVAYADDMADASRYYAGKDFVQAMKLYTKLAQEGRGDAQQMLGEMYWYGDGVAVDRKSAELWFSKAADNGNAKAKQFLQIIAERAKRAGDISFYTTNFDGQDLKLSNFKCVRPEVPAESKTNEEIKKVSADIAAWVTCYNQFAERLNAALPVGKSIPEDLASLMTDDEMAKAIALMDKTYSAIAADTSKLAAEISAQQEAWKKNTEEFVTALNKKATIENEVRKRQAAANVDRMRAEHTVYSSSSRK